MASDITHAVRKLRQEGYKVEMGPGGHWHVCKADGSYLTSLPATSRNKRVLNNLKRNLRHGLRRPTVTHDTNEAEG